MERRVFAAGTILAGLGVALGAFGAHGLRGVVGTEHLGTFETAVRYQMYHALALLALAWAISRWPERQLAPAVALLGVGVAVFSGSLYLLVLTGARWLGAITPVGGIALITGWALVAWRMTRQRGENRPE